MGQRPYPAIVKKRHGRAYGSLKAKLRRALDGIGGVHQSAGTAMALHGIQFACCVRDSLAFGRVLAAIRSEYGVVAKVLPDRLLADVSVIQRCAALIHDLEPYDYTALITVRRFRKRYPTPPILLYVPDRREISSLVRAACELPGVSAIPQSDRSGTLRLREFVRTQLWRVPSEHLAQVVRLLFVGLPSQVEAFIDSAVNRLGRNAGRDVVTVNVLAQELNLSLRGLERACNGISLPGPKELLDWLTLLFIMYTADRNQTSSAISARATGVDAQRLYRLRRRLLPGCISSRHAQADQEFSICLLAFAGRCRHHSRSTVDPAAALHQVSRLPGCA